MLEFSTSNYAHSSAKLVSFNEQGFTVGSSGSGAHAKTEVLNFQLDTNGDIIPSWTIKPDYPNAQSIYFYAAVAIQSSVYLFGGLTVGFDSSDRVVVFENNDYEDVGYLKFARYGHEIIQVGDIIYIIGGIG